MPPKSENLKNLGILLATMSEDHLGKKDFVDHFKKVVERVLEIDRRNLETFKEMTGSIDAFKSKLGGDSTTAINLALSQLQDRVETQLSSSVKQQQEGMNTLRDKLMDIKDFTDGLDGVDADEEVIFNRLMDEMRNLIPEKEEMSPLSASDIKDLDKFIRDRIPQRGGSSMSGPNANAVLAEDLSTQCNGETKTFRVPRHRIALGLHCSQFPFIYRPTTDFTTANLQLNLTSEVAAPETNQTLIFQYVK